MFYIAHRILTAVSLICAVRGNTITIYNAGAIGHTLVWEANPGECDPMHDLDFIPPGGSLCKDDPILSKTCKKGTQWAGRFRTIPGDSVYTGSHSAALHAAEEADATIAEFAFDGYTKHTYYDASRVNLGCNPQVPGVKWIYPEGFTDKQYQSGCGGDPGSCWNMYVYSTNDIMQLSHESTDYVVVLGDEGYTHCDPSGQQGFECCTVETGCASGRSNPPVSIVTSMVTPVDKAPYPSTIFNCPISDPSSQPQAANQPPENQPAENQQADQPTAPPTPAGNPPGPQPPGLQPPGPQAPVEAPQQEANNAGAANEAAVGNQPPGPQPPVEAPQQEANNAGAANEAAVGNQPPGPQPPVEPPQQEANNAGAANEAAVGNQPPSNSVSVTPTITTTIAPNGQVKVETAWITVTTIVTKCVGNASGCYNTAVPSPKLKREDPPLPVAFAHHQKHARGLKKHSNAFGH